MHCIIEKGYLQLRKGYPCFTERFDEPGLLNRKRNSTTTSRISPYLWSSQELAQEMGTQPRYVQRSKWLCSQKQVHIKGSAGSITPGWLSCSPHYYCRSVFSSLLLLSLPRTTTAPHSMMLVTALASEPRLPQSPKMPQDGLCLPLILCEGM